MLNKILYGIKKFEKKKKNKKVTIITLTFSIIKYEKTKNGNRLSITTKDLLHLMNESGEKHNLKNEVTVHFVDDQLQKTESDTCEYFNFIFT